MPRTRSTQGVTSGSNSALGRAGALSLSKGTAGLPCQTPPGVYWTRWSRATARLMVVLVSACRCAEMGAALVLTQDGQSDYVIARAGQATEAELFAARELAEFLQRSTGAALRIVTEDTLTGARAIYVGHTEFARKQGIGIAELGEEEWVIRSVKGDLIITGGRPRGTLYGAYEFLERQVGCHWLDRETEVIPSRPSLTLGRLDLRGKPWFWQRWVHSPTGTPDDKWRFMVRNKNYRYDLGGRRDFFPQGTFHKIQGYPNKVHSFSYYVNAKDWFETHPEYFSLGRNGERLPAYDGAGPGQLCLTNPKVRRLTLGKLREFIARDRTEASGNGCPPPRVYGINQNDKYHAHCQCPACQAIAAREGGESGPLIAFVNAVAEGVEEEYPEVLIGTIAYNLTSTPPRHLKPRGNVLVGWCDVYSKCDGIRPLKHPYNSLNHAEITGWGEVASRLAIGDDYWTSLSYYSHFPTPYSIIECVASDLKLFAELGAESFFAESAEYMEAGQQFVPLKFWLAYQLLVDPRQPVEPLIKTFMDGYYRAAAGRMSEYLKYLRRRIDADAQFKMLRDAPHKLKYLDVDFFVTAERLFGEAESLVEPDSLESNHIRDERFILDGALLFLWPWLERKLAPEASMPFDHETVISRYEKEWRAFVKGRYSRFYTKHELSLNQDGKLLARMTGWFRDPNLPEQFRSLPPRHVADFNWLTFSGIRPRQRFVVDDDAAGGMAAEPAGMSRIEAAEQGAGGTEGGEDAGALSFGVTGGATVTLRPEEAPQDGKYHLYRIGRVRVSEGTTVWALDGKRLGVNVDRLFVPNAEDPQINVWDAHISLKVTGPAYIRGSTKPNGAWMDRVLLVRPQEGEEPDPAFARQREKERRRLTLRPKVRVPRLPTNAGGDPRKVDWEKAVSAGEWCTLKGGPTGRKVAARLAQDGEYLYVRLLEELSPETLVTDSRIWGGDDWELLFAAERGTQPYRQIGINPKGEHVELAYGEGPWDSEARVLSETDADSWKVSVAFPLSRLLPGGVRPGQSVYANVLRGGRDPLAWSPTFEGNFHALERLGEIILE